MRVAVMFAGLALMGAPTLAEQAGMSGMDHSQTEGIGNVGHGPSN